MDWCSLERVQKSVWPFSILHFKFNWRSLRGRRRNGCNQQYSFLESSSSFISSGRGHSSFIISYLLYMVDSFHRSRISRWFGSRTISVVDVPREVEQCYIRRHTDVRLERATFPTAPNAPFHHTTNIHYWGTCRRVPAADESEQGREWLSSRSRSVCDRRWTTVPWRNSSDLGTQRQCSPVLPTRDSLHLELRLLYLYWSILPNLTVMSEKVEGENEKVEGHSIVDGTTKRPLKRSKINLHFVIMITIGNQHIWRRLKRQ